VVGPGKAAEDSAERDQTLPKTNATIDSSSIGQLPQPPPWHGLKLFDISEGWIPTSLTRKVRPETVMFYMAMCDVFT
jgi:hypothetical protein